MDRVDYKFKNADSLQLNLGFTRWWFQTPDSYDDLNIGVTDASGNFVGAADQRSQIKTFNPAPSWTHILGPNSVFTSGTLVRRDQFKYYPSANPVADFSPSSRSRLVRIGI